MGASALAIVPDVVCVAMCGAAATTDLRAYRIPNWLTASGAVLGVAANVALAAAIGSGAAWTLVLIPMVVGGLTLLVVSGALGAMGWMGMGDVKLLAAAGLCVRWPNALAVFLYTTLAGGALAAFLAVRRRQLRQVAQNLSEPAALDVRQTVNRMPYGVAIFAGVCWAIAARHVSQLALV